VTARLYQIFTLLSRLVGLWPIRVTSALVAVAYFLFFPRRLRGSLRFYRALWPRRSRLFALWCAWRQYQDFARLYSERLEIDRRADVVFETEGDNHIAEAKAKGQGAILVMSHFGRWEIGARLLAQRQEKLTLVMGGEDAGRARAGVDEALRGAGLGVVTVPAGEGQAFDILEALEVLRQGGIVSLAADRTWGEARVLQVPFLGHTALIAAAPFALALVSGAPLLTVFAAKLGRRHYRFFCGSPIPLHEARRADREKAMEQAASAYLERLRAMVLAHPEQWHNFGEFMRMDTH